MGGVSSGRESSEEEESELEEDEKISERGREWSPVASNPLRCYMKEVITVGGGGQEVRMESGRKAGNERRLWVKPDHRHHDAI